MKQMLSTNIVGHASRIRERVFFSRKNTSSLNTGTRSAGEKLRYREETTSGNGNLIRQPATRMLSLPILFLCCLPFFSSKAVPADELFSRAMEIRAERPDEAAPLFTEAALEFEAEQQFFNAGNSWFFAGEDGRALANYRAAESRRPTNRQIRESIQFILAQRTDSFQTSESNSVASQRFAAHDQNAWSKFCRWSPALRFGALTLLYLAGWAAFLIARITGKTIRRKAWITYGIPAAIIVLSLLWSFCLPARGVVIQSTDARLGPGYAYEPAYGNILHDATEFQWLEKRDDWVLARLPDDSEAWLRETACVKIR